jgi:hypothetical protein
MLPRQPSPKAFESVEVKHLVAVFLGEAVKDDDNSITTQSSK